MIYILESELESLCDMLCPLLQPATGVEGTGRCFSTPATENVLEFYGVQAINSLGEALEQAAY